VVEGVEEGSGEWGVGSGEEGEGLKEKVKVRMWFWTGVREGI